MTRIAFKRTARVLIALDPAAPAPGALEALAAFAADVTPELTCIFVEDANLRRLCGLSFVREVSIDTGTEQGLSLEYMERQFRLQRARMERLVSDVAHRLRLPHRFHVVQGEVLDELRRAAAETDLFLVGRSSAVAGARSWMGARLHELVSLIPGTLAIIQDPWRTGRSIVVIAEDSEAGRAALAVAARLAVSENIELIILRGAEAAHDEQQRERLARSLRETTPGLVPRWVELVRAGPLELAALARRENARCVVLPVAESVSAAEFVESLLRRTECSIVAVHAGTAGEAAATTA